MSKTYKAPEVQKALGISRKTLYNWIKDGLIPEPRRFPPKTGHRFWTEADLNKLRKITGRG